MAIVATGSGNVLQQALASLGQGISKIQNPMQDIQAMVRNLIIQNPDVGRQLARVERESPGTIDNMLGLSKKKPTQLYQNIMGMQPTSGMMKEDIVKKGIADLDQGTIDEIISQATTGMSRGQVATSGAVASATKESPKQAGQQAVFGGPIEEFGAKKSAAELDADMYNSAYDFLQKQNIDNKERYAAFANIKGLLEHHISHERLDVEKLKNSTDYNDWLGRNRESEIDWWIKATGKGAGKEGRAAWANMLYGNKDIKTEADKEVAGALNSVSVDKLAVKDARLNNDIDESVKALTAKDKNGIGFLVPDKSVRAQLVSKLQTDLDQRSSLLGQKQFKVIDDWQPGILYGENLKGIKIVDLETGEPVDPSALDAISVLPTSKIKNASATVDPSKLSPGAKRAFEDISKPGVDKVKAEEALRKASLKIYNELKAAGAI